MTKVTTVYTFSENRRQYEMTSEMEEKKEKRAQERKEKTGQNRRETHLEEKKKKKVSHPSTASFQNEKKRIISACFALPPLHFIFDHFLFSFSLLYESLLRDPLGDFEQPWEVVQLIFSLFLHTSYFYMMLDIYSLIPVF